MRAPVLGVVVLALLLAACGRSGSGARNAEMRSFRAAGVGANADPTLRSARLLPENVDETTTYGTEAGGGSRVITAGLRVVTYPKGAIVAAEDRLPQAPHTTVALPDRLGGGFLFVIGTTLWRADRWLGPAKPIFTSSSPMQAILPGLDRVYVRAQNAVLAIDGRSGQVLDLGPWPASPYVASYAAADGWRAAAVTDMRGVVATFDAGATWKALDLPLDAKQVVVSSDSLAIGGYEGGRSESWYELRADGSIARLGAAPRGAKLLTSSPSAQPAHARGGLAPPPVPTPGVLPLTFPPMTPRSGSDRDARPDTDKEDVAAKTFGKRPLATAIEDGWPLTDGTAVIARDGALARVRLADGALLELVRDAFPLESARCHPLTLTRPNAVGAFGFVCGEPRGTTVIYAYEPLRGRLAEIKRFDRPRVVTSSGNGALAVRGPCAEDGEPTPPPRPDPAKLERSKEELERDRAKEPATKANGKAKDDPRAAGAADAAKAPSGGEPKPPAKAPEGEGTPPRAPVSEVHPYCVLGHDNTWREIHVRGDVGGERVVVLADGRIVVVSPPQSLGTPARITILDRAGSSARATTMPVIFPRVANDVGRVLRLGLWLDGFEERRPGVVGGWIEAGGVMLGLEIALDGKATPGQFIRDAGMPFVAGRYGLGWTASRRGYETTDGGMTWSTIDLPDPLVPAARVERRACGPIGCLAHGWLRVGWGESSQNPAAAPPPPYRAPSASLTTPQLQLACEPLAAMPQAAPASKPKVAPPAPSSSLGHFSSYGNTAVLATFNGLAELPPFFSQAAPSLRDSERGLNVDVREHIERYSNLGSLARVYGWGPRTGEWETLGRWQVKWLSPFSGYSEVRASLPGTPPQIIIDMTRATQSYYGLGAQSSGFQLAPGDDASHALLTGKRVGRLDGVVFELEADRAPVEVRRADGEPFGEIEGVVRSAGRWFVTSPSAPGAASPMTVVWQIEGGVARELVRVPRASSPTSSSSRTKLARRSDGRAIALVAEGQPTAERSTNVRWALPIDLETGTSGEPEPLGYVDLAGRTLEACTDDVVGWVLDTTMPSSSVRLRLPQGGGALSAVLARLRLTSSRACVERVAGTYDGQSQERAAQLARAGAGASAARGTPALRPGELFATAMSAQTRFPLRCSLDRQAK
ncbi:MAG: hypothetical protein KF795_29455 [Labilithrix sp.]|nr:hypothetical protein [Labilithrix sp.]